MRRVINSIAIVFVLSGLSLATGCQKEGTSGAGNKDVMFGAQAKNELATRTAYGDYDNADSPTEQAVN